MSSTRMPSGSVYSCIVIVRWKLQGQWDFQKQWLGVGKSICALNCMPEHLLRGSLKSHRPLQLGVAAC